jgi:hypothetical protein
MSIFRCLKKKQKKKDKLDLILDELTVIRQRIGELGLDIYCAKATLSHAMEKLQNELIK